jgi:hypothetical protein
MKRNREVPDLSAAVECYIDALWIAYKMPECDKRYLRKLICDLMKTAYLVDTVLKDFGVKPQSSMGRHSRLSTKEEDAKLDFYCWRRCEELQRSGMGVTKAWDAVGREEHLSAGAVRARCKKIENEGFPSYLSRVMYSARKNFA